MAGGRKGGWAALACGKSAGRRGELPVRPVCGDEKISSGRIFLLHEGTNLVFCNCESLDRSARANFAEEDEGKN